MKRITALILAALLVLGLSLTAAAAEASVQISADGVKAAPGQEITVPIRITGNKGFTNFGIALDYDRESLTLTGIQLTDGEKNYLCGSLAAANPDWTDEAGASFGYVTCANLETVTEDGILFTATFLVSEALAGSAEVTPVVKYLRLGDQETSLFASLLTQEKSGYIRTHILSGDFNDDGIVSIAEAAEAVRAYLGTERLSEEKLSTVDADGDGTVSTAEITEVLGNYHQ